MAKPKIICWGGFFAEQDRPLKLSQLNSHASVTCHFLSRALENRFRVVQIPSYFRASEIAEHGDAIAAVSTFQAGFSRLKKDDPACFEEITRGFPGKLCSIVDLVSLGRYAEDILFTVLPPETGIKNLIKNTWSGAEVAHMGWCADVQRCRPLERKTGRFRVFLDHGHYAGEDYTGLLIEALNAIAREGRHELEIFWQGNSGIEPWPVGKPWHGERFDRAAKVPWQDVQKWYATCDLFCVTHRESAGLGAIEAAMSGAMLLVPEIGGPLISPGLLTSDIPHRVVAGNIEDLRAAIDGIATAGVDRKANHARVAAQHGWHVAARRISDRLT